MRQTAASAGKYRHPGVANDLGTPDHPYRQPVGEPFGGHAEDTIPNPP